MKKFKDFRNIPDESIVFANGGGPKDQYKDFGKIDDSLVFANGGGPKDQYKDFDKDSEITQRKIKENLNPRNDSEVIKTSNDILYDPIRNNRSMGSNHPKKIGIPEGANDYVYPHFTDEHAKHLRTLLEHSNRSHPYHSIVDSYTATSQPLNYELFQRARFGSPPPKHVTMPKPYGFKLNIKDLDELIDRHKLPHDMTVYSGLHFDPNDKRGKIVKLPAYTSVSLSPHVAKDFGQSFDSDDNWFVNHHIMRLHLPAGHPHLLTDHSSQFPGQGELILPRNMRLQMGTKPTHIIQGNFKSHFDDELEFSSSRHLYHIWNARVLPNAN